MASKEKNSDIAYIIPSKYDGMDLKVLRTANAWWLDVSKVYRLLDAFDNHEASIGEACGAAGISIRQYKYFAQLHPLINTRRKIGQYEIYSKKKIALTNAVYNGNPKSAMQYLRFVEPETYDLRYRSTPLSRLKRKFGIPVHPKPKSEEQKQIEMEKEVEKTRKLILQRSKKDFINN